MLLQHRRNPGKVRQALTDKDVGDTILIDRESVSFGTTGMWSEELVTKAIKNISFPFV